MVSNRVAILGADSFFMCVLLFTFSQVLASLGIGAYTYLAYARLGVVLIIFHDMMHNAVAKSVSAFQLLLLIVDTIYGMINLYIANYISVPFFAFIIVLQYVQAKNTFALWQEKISAEIGRGLAIRKFGMSMGLAEFLLGLASPAPFAFLTYFLLQMYSLYYEMSSEDVRTQRIIVNSATLFWGCVCTWVAVGTPTIVGTIILMFCCVDILLDVLIIISTIKTPQP